MDWPLCKCPVMGIHMETYEKKILPVTRYCASLTVFPDGPVNPVQMLKHTPHIHHNLYNPQCLWCSRVCPGMLHKWTFCWSANCRKRLLSAGICQASECGSLLIMSVISEDSQQIRMRNTPELAFSLPWGSLKLPFNKREIHMITAWVCKKPGKQLNRWQLFLFLS